MTISLIELVLEFDPLEPESVEEALHEIHAHEDSNCDVDEDGPAYEHCEERASSDTASDCLFEENLEIIIIYFGELAVGKRESP